MKQSEIIAMAIQAGSEEAYGAGGLRRDFSFTGAQLAEFANLIEHQTRIEHVEHTGDGAAIEITKLREENERLHCEMLTPDVFQRIVDWLKKDPIPSASRAFTASMERQIAYALEMDVVPMLKSARFICTGKKETPGDW